MKLFYPRLALDGIRKNRRLFLPYILAGSMMVMMYYILSYLSEAPALMQMEGGTMLSVILPLGCFVIAAFCVLFLFYTNGFLIKQRYREFGLYSILGMDKKNICRLMVWENLFVWASAVAVGLAAGILLSKLAELGLMNLLGMDISYELNVGIRSLWQTPAVFSGIYLLLLIYSLIRVSRSNPLELLQSSRAGERSLKHTWLFALAGVLILGFAYYLAVMIEEPLVALLWFFVAVLLVILATYLLFIAGSVSFCKLLQKNKKYYYQPNHFVSVSSMVYRMKRNGAGLASICILLTMVLVMISSTGCLYFGAEDALAARCPNSVNISTTFHSYEGIDDDNLEEFRELIRRFSGKDADLQGVRACEVPAIVTEGGVLIDIENAAIQDLSTYRDGYLAVISLSDYNHLMKQDQTLGPRECLLYCSRLQITSETFSVDHGETYTVKEHLTDFKVDGETLAMTFPVVYLVVEDLDDFAEPFGGLKDSSGTPIMVYDWRCGFDLEHSDTEKSTVTQLNMAMTDLAAEDDNGLYLDSLDVFSREGRRESFYEMYGSLLFLGIVLSILFLIAAVLIVYYKQLCEGYEDHARFDIMQKVGMTKEDIRRSINSQMLTVFFLPLLLAGVHLYFAFPFIAKILLMFAFDNTALSIAVNLICFAAFGLFYTLVYRLTSGAYYSIVNGGGNA